MSEGDPQAANETTTATQHLGVVGFLRAIVPYFAPHKLTALLIVFTMLVDLAYATVVPLLFQALIDDAIVPHDMGMLSVILGTLAAGAAIATVAGFGQDVAYARAGVAVMNAIRLRLFSHLQGLSADYYARTQIGDIVSRFSSDLASVENGLIWYLPSILQAVGGFVLSVGLLFRIEWRLALLSVIGLLVSFWIARRFEPSANLLSYQLKEEIGVVAVAVEENLHAQAVVKGFNLQRQQRERFRGKLDALFVLSRRANWIGFFMARIPNVGALLMNFATLGIGSYLVFAGTMTMGKLVAFYTLFGQVSLAVTSLTYSTPSLLEGSAGMERLDEVLRETPTVEDGKDAAPLPALERAIELKAVTFGYTATSTSLEDISLTIPKGQYVAFVGASGSGKSTVLNLVDRFYDPRTGSVRYDGRDIRELTLDALRAQIGVVFQESILFDTTIRENIRFGRAGATDAEVEEAAKQAEIHDFIETLPERYDTQVGERGSRLSGGQRQRVAIARALVRRPSVLLLDEATSALDPQTESLVDETLRKVARDRTVLSVTHRLAPVVHCDAIFVLDRGKLVEQGTHDDLIAKDGVYAKLWEKQQGFTVSEDGGRAEISAERLSRVPLFSKLDHATLADIAGQMSSASRDAGAVLVREGDPGNEFFVVARGRVEVLKRTRDGRQERVEIFDDGDYFGEISLMRNVLRTATLRTLTATTYLAMKREHFLRLIERLPGMKKQLEEEIDERLRENAAVEASPPGSVKQPPTKR
jgi:ATP-binding cassette, subfamily B, bacterial